MGTLFLILFFGFFLIVIFAQAIRIVPEYQRLVVFRLGRVIGERGPGLVFLLPFVDKAVRVDLREQFREIPEQTAITKDNAPIAIDFLIYWRVIDPVASVIQVGDFVSAAVGIATTTLRAVIGDIMLDDVLARREQINEILRTKLDEVTERWGVKITTVEIREITPPRDIQDAMNRQMSAERNRRAMVTEADGQREAAIKVAEGEKQAAILRAEGEKEAAILQAEGERQAQILRAKGYALALSTISEAARAIDANTMALQYMEVLKSLGSSPASKWVVPAELFQFAQTFTGGSGDVRTNNGRSE